MLKNDWMSVHGERGSTCKGYWMTGSPERKAPDDLSGMIGDISNETVSILDLYQVFKTSSCFYARY